MRIVGAPAPGRRPPFAFRGGAVLLGIGVYGPATSTHTLTELDASPLWSHSHISAPERCAVADVTALTWLTVSPEALTPRVQGQRIPPVRRAATIPDRIR